ncbi:hypothetical protein K439DRAFT_684897 [Ramaria rubella]|nr:hypothetical protein K439DRAFT_684897 [Ramaria rubella]
MRFPCLDARNVAEYGQCYFHQRRLVCGLLLGSLIADRARPLSFNCLDLPHIYFPPMVFSFGQIWSFSQRLAFSPWWDIYVGDNLTVIGSQQPISRYHNSLTQVASRSHTVSS